MGRRAAVVEPEKCAELRWFPLTALPDPVVPHELQVLDGLRSGTVAAYTTFGFDQERSSP